MCMLKCCPLMILIHQLNWLPARLVPDLTQPDLEGLSNPDLMKQIALTMLSAAVNRQYNSVLLLLCHCLPVFDTLWNGNEFCIFVIRVTLINILNTPLDMSRVLLLSVINWTYCTCTGIRQEIWPEPNLARFLKNCLILDLPVLVLKSGASQATSSIASFCWLVAS